MWHIFLGENKHFFGTFCTLIPKIIKNKYENEPNPIRTIVHGRNKSILGVLDQFLIFFSRTFRPWPDVVNSSLKCVLSNL